MDHDLIVGSAFSRQCFLWRWCAGPCPSSAEPGWPTGELSNGGVICSEVLEVRTSSSRPGQGFVKCRTTTLNQNVEPVQVLVMNLLVQAQPR